jgi:hypothetical protein
MVTSLGRGQDNRYLEDGGAFMASEVIAVDAGQQLPEFWDAFLFVGGVMPAHGGSVMRVVLGAPAPSGTGASNYLADYAGSRAISTASPLVDLVDVALGKGR